MKKISVIIFLISAFTIESFSQVWNDDFNGIDSIWSESAPGGLNPITINCLYNYNDSIVYLGGGVAYTNSTFASCFASWNTDTIITYQQGVEYGGVNAIIRYKDTLYIGGSFHSASENPNTANLAIWSGSNWRSTSIGEVNAYVYDFCIYHDTLFIAGNFEDIGELECKKIVAYNGEEWINVGDMGMWTKALAVFNDELYAGGYWGVRKYLGGTAWETFNPRPNGYVNELMTDTINSFLFVGGQFSAIDDEDSWGCAMWDGFTWNPMGTAYGSTVWPQASAMYRGEYYVGNGTRHHIEEDRWEFFIRKWNGESWDSIGGAFNSSILSLEVFRDTLYIGGNFGFWGGNSLMPDKRTKGMVKLYMPDNGCDYLKPRINTYTDTFYLNSGEAIVNLYNNNPYADSWEWNFNDGQYGDVKDPVHTYTAIGEYNVQVTVSQDGCIKTANKTIYIEEGSSIDDFKSLKMQVFPNPSSHNFTVKLVLTDYKNAEIKIAGLNGHLVDIIPVFEETTIIPTKGWKPGTYICNLFVDGKLVKVVKLIFQK